MQLAFPAILQRPRAHVPARLVTWILCWILLPNLAFCAMWAVGGPPRYPEILATGTIGLIVRKARFPIKYAAFCVALIYSVLSFISALFNLAIASLIASLQFLIELRPAASIEYVTMAVLLVATLAAGWKLLKRPTDFEPPWQLLAAAAALFVFSGADLWMSEGNRGSYKRVAPDGAPFLSATGQSRFAGLATRDRHLLIVVVEAMGLPRDAALRARLLGRWRQSDIGRVYEVESGSTPYYGSTTNAEVRELCGHWGDYAEYMEGYHERCLPARLAADGYETTAIHSFDGGFFERTQWYPNVGFEHSLFRDDLVGRGAGKCPGVFPAACDRDIPAIIAGQLKGARDKQFIYWLTVNSHLPVPSEEALRTDQCARIDPELAESHPMTCRLFALWGEVNRGLAAILTDPDLPPTDVLIVGDHAPPFFDREERSLFDGEKVPWVLLTYKDEAASAEAVRLAGRPQE